MINRGRLELAASPIGEGPKYIFKTKGPNIKSSFIEICMYGIYRKAKKGPISKVVITPRLISQEPKWSFNILAYFNSWPIASLVPVA